MTGEIPGPDSSNPDAIFGQSMAAFQRRDFERAILYSNRLMEISNEAGPAIVWAVRLRLESQRWHEAIEIGSRGLDKSLGLSGLVGHALEAIGDLEGAQKQFERACREQPENPSWFMHNASALSRLHRDFESMEVLQNAIAIAANPDPNALLILAAQELSFGYPARAVETAERALTLNPKIDGGHPLVARSLMAMGRYEESETRWAHAQALSPWDQGLPFQRAVALVRHGQFDRGIDALTKILERNPSFIPALTQIAGAKRISEADRSMISRMEDLLTDSTIGEEDRIALRYSLGKAHDNLGEFGTAIEHFDHANGLKFRAIEETGGFDRPGYAANMTLRTNVYSRDVVEKLVAHGNPSETPIFVLGVIRSGTTLAEQILSSHPLVAGAGELDFWINTDLRLMDYTTQNLRVETLRVAAEAYLRLIGGFSTQDSIRVVDKQPGNLILAAALHIAFPNARIIYMRRHPVDTAISIWTTHLRTSTRFVNDKGNIAYAFKQHDRLMKHWQEVIPPDRFMQVSYESLITDRESMTRKMLEFCGLPWSDACMAPEKNEKLVLTPSLWQVRQPVYRTSIDRWRNYEPWLGEFRELLLPADSPKSAGQAL